MIFEEGRELALSTEIKPKMRRCTHGAPIQGGLGLEGDARKPHKMDNLENAVADDQRRRYRDITEPNHDDDDD